MVRQGNDLVTRLHKFLSRHTEFIGHVATMISGRTLAAVIALFTVPIIARLFSPSDFGVAAVFASIVGMSSNIAALRYEAAIVLPKRDSEARALLAFAHRVLLVVCAAMLLFVGIYEASGARLSALELLGSWKWLLPLGVLIMTTLQIQGSWLTRNKSFNITSASLVVGNAVTGGARIGFGALSGSSVYGLIISYLLGMTCRLAVQRAASWEGFRATFSRLDWQVTRELARRYSDFPKLNAPAALVFSLGQNLPVLLFGVMFSPAAAGLYAMANRLSRVPVGVVATSMRRVFLQKAAEVKNRGGNLRRAFLLASGGLAVLGAVPFMSLWLFGQPLAAWVLGERWFAAGRYLEIVAPWLFMLWVMAPVNSIFVVLREQRLWLFLQVVLTVLRLGAFGVAYLVTAGPEWTLQAFVTVTVLGNLTTIGVALTLISRHARRESAGGTAGLASPADSRDARTSAKEVKA